MSSAAQSADDAARRARQAARASSDRGQGWTAPVFVISAAAEMAQMHPQTLRQYDRIGLVVPQRQGGRQRRYSRADVDRLRTVQALSRDGVSLEGIRRIVDLEREVEQLQDVVAELAGQVDRMHQVSRISRVFTVGAQGEASARYSDSAVRRSMSRSARTRAQAQERAAAHGQERTQGASSENLDERSAHTDSPQQPAWAPSVRALPAGSTAERKVLVWKRARD
ncbi:MerR family transcriptional regulator/heat shock protein HspR [Micrococcus cohnii]|uniref:MerR family transcriptional regulator/heat shock protein HspR n=1 Tax=Micrococcus cohnii TaxID=993416 RepID=A0A7W7GPH5_9MICC|nr:MerR family transcriptional regulator/heat shock protein HspR [Micrococcus cohnii]